MPGFAAILKSGNCTYEMICIEMVCIEIVYIKITYIKITYIKIAYFCQIASPIPDTR